LPTGLRNDPSQRVLTVFTDVQSRPAVVLTLAPRASTSATAAAFGVRLRNDTSCDVIETPRECPDLPQH